MDSGARRDWERQGIPNGRAGRSEPTRAEYSADMWNTKLMCTRRAESTQRNIRTNEGWQIWRGYGMQWLKSKESNFEMDPSWDWKPVEVFQKGGCAGPWSGECNNPSKCVLNPLYARQILARDAKQTGVGIVQPGRDKSAGDEIGGAFTKNWSDVAKGANVIETWFR